MPDMGLMGRIGQMGRMKADIERAGSMSGRTGGGDGNG